MTEKKENSLKKRVLRFVCAATLLSFILLFTGWGVAHAGALSTEAVNAVEAVAQQQGYVITGTVVDSYGEELIGVSVQLRSNMTIGTATDIDGNFSIRIPGMNDVLVFTFIGMTTQELRLVPGTTHYRVVMVEDAAVLGEVVVTGFFERDRATMTGAASSFCQEDLMGVGTINVLQALRTLEPSFIMIENIQAGSDPNRMATFELRGQTALSIAGVGEEADPTLNMPLFLIDSFEATLEEVNDLDISRIASITILKDAGSTAIFGARGANGVIVIETVRPAPGRVDVRYTGNFEVSWADLSVYNMMNAHEKLEFEILSGHFGNLNNPENMLGRQRYERVRRRVAAGVDVDWLRVPIRVGFTQNHSVNVSGGDDVWLFSTGLNYRNVEGVMQGSRRQTYGGNLRIVYRGVQNLNITNNISVGVTNANRGGWGNFSEFVRANPYLTPFNDYGQLLRHLDTGVWTPTGIDGAIPNPLWNASLFTHSDDHTMSLTNNTGINWQVTPTFRVEGNLSLRHSTTNAISFVDARDTRFDGVDPTRSGSFTERNARNLGYNADIRVSYVLRWRDVHMFNFMGRTAIADQVSESSSFRATGFPEGGDPLPSFAYSFAYRSRPSFSHHQRRSASAMMAVNYNFLHRYFADITLNREGSNHFGSRHLWTTIWSAGAGWNIHREAFAENWTWLRELRLRGNYGLRANQGGRHLTTNIYRFRPGSNLFGMSSTLYGFGNPYLNWTVVREWSGGIDLSLNTPRPLSFRFNAFHRMSDPLALFLPQFPSTGVGQFAINRGVMETIGYDVRITYSPIHNVRERRILTVHATASSNRSTYWGFEGLFDDLNRDLWAHAEATLADRLRRWEDGRSPQDIWAVPSLGIDPATGVELFLNRHGMVTDRHYEPDRRVVGNSRPVVEGVFGASFVFRQLTGEFHFRYRLGSYALNRALFERVENIGSGDLGFNHDRRALYDRWRNPGDVSQFRAINLHAGTPLSSRFVQRRNQLTGESVRLTWNFDREEWIRQLHLQRLNAGISMRDIFYLSNVKEERGINFPFARAVLFNINATF